MRDLVPGQPRKKEDKFKISLKLRKVKRLKSSATEFWDISRKTRELETTYIFEKLDADQTPFVIQLGFFNSFE